MLNLLNHFILKRVIEACNKWLSGEEVPTLSEDCYKRGNSSWDSASCLKRNETTCTTSSPNDTGFNWNAHWPYCREVGWRESKIVRFLDPTVGTGNLLYTVMNTIGKDVTANAVEIDELLVRLSAVTAEIT